MPVKPPEPSGRTQPPRPGGLGERILDGLLWLVENTILRLWALILWPFQAFWEWLADWLYEKFNAGVEGTVRLFDKDIRGDDEWVVFIQEFNRHPLPFRFILLFGLVMGGIGSVGKSFVDNTLKRTIAEWNFRTNRAFPIFRMASDDGVMGERRGAVSKERVIEDLKDLGISEDRIPALLAQAHRWVSTTQIEDFYWRGIFGPPGQGGAAEARAKEELRGIGLKDEHVDISFQAFPRLVPLSDLQRMAIREVFTPELAEPLKHPTPGPRYYEEAEKLGMPREKAEWYWMAHWRLISITQGMDAMRRMDGQDGRPLFSEDDFEELMRRDDVLSKYWDVLKFIRYRPMNRLDIFRVATSGKFPREWVIRQYKDYGYSPELAEEITDYAITSRVDADRDLTKSDILDLYKRRAITRADTMAFLQELGFLQEEVELLITRADLQLAQSRTSSSTATVRQRFLAGLISEPQAVNDLLDMGKPQEEIEDLLELWRFQRDQRIERPTVSQLLGFYADRTISGPTLQEELRREGYDDRYIGWYIESADARIRAEEERKSEAELREQLRLQRVPTKADLATWLRAEIITEEDFARRMLDQGYSAEDVANFAARIGVALAVPFYKTEEGKLRVRTVQELFRRGQLTLEQLEQALIQLGTSPEIADAITDYEVVRQL
jgi:hypothetical protein